MGKGDLRDSTKGGLEQVSFKTGKLTFNPVVRGRSGLPLFLSQPSARLDTSFALNSAASIEESYGESVMLKYGRWVREESLNAMAGTPYMTEA